MCNERCREWIDFMSITCHYTMVNMLATSLSTDMLKKEEEEDTWQGESGCFLWVYLFQNVKGWGGW